MAEPIDPLDVDNIDWDDDTARHSFYDALIAKGAARVREQRMKAFQDGLIDKDGFVIDRSLLTDIDERLTVEQ